MSEIHREGKVPTLGCVDSCYSYVCVYILRILPLSFFYILPLPFVP